MSRTYVLDTSVLLTAGAAALRVFEEHQVVLPLVVIRELEGKRNDPEIGWVSRQVLRALEEMRVRAAEDATPGLDSPQGVTVNDQGGTLRIELNHIDQADLPRSLRDERSNDMRIIAVAQALAKDGRDVVLVSRDLPMRLLAGGVLGMAAEDYRHDQVVDDGYSGIEHLHLGRDVIDTMFASKYVAANGVVGMDSVLANTGLVLHGPGSQSALAVLEHPGLLMLLKHPAQEAFGLKPRSAEQRIALHHLLNEKIGIVSLGGRAGTGKTALALAAGLESVLERRTHDKIVVFRPMYSVGGQDLGYLPGSVEEKTEPWAAAIKDALAAFCAQAVLEEIQSRNLIEVLPLTHIRGRTLTRTFTIIDEAQNLERPVLLSALSRTGQGSKVVLTHDRAQRDNLRVGRHDGIATVIERLKGEPMFAHVTLARSERSAVAELVTRLLDAGE